jgi:hypothetical protein
VVLSDGPVNEAAELVGGFYLVQAPSRDQAVALAQRIPVGPDGSVELRPIWELG